MCTQGINKGCVIILGFVGV
uniref:Uncharacterized protein n=1 Tax=Anguilla anguilla TaxID=7936 RepID=A0A0E9QPR3_ANGAN